jgi:hypothetical protein
MVDLTSFGAKTGIFQLKNRLFGGRRKARLFVGAIIPAV